MADSVVYSEGLTEFPPRPGTLTIFWPVRAITSVGVMSVGEWSTDPKPRPVRQCESVDHFREAGETIELRDARQVRVHRVGCGRIRRDLNIANLSRALASGCDKLSNVGSALPARRSCSPYEVVLGEAFASLHAHVRRAHLPPLRAEGTIDVEHGTGWLARPMIWVDEASRRGAPSSGAARRRRGRLGVWCGRAASVGQFSGRVNARSGSRLVERSGLGRVSFRSRRRGRRAGVSAVIPSISPVCPCHPR